MKVSKELKELKDYSAEEFKKCYNENSKTGEAVANVHVEYTIRIDKIIDGLDNFKRKTETLFSKL